jgi:hypothetical protein
VTDGIQTAIDNGVLAPGGQGGPQPQPEPGFCNTYHVQLNANNRWLCPIPVQAGDKITLSNANGAWWDGDTLSSAWYCPNGQRWLLVTCSDTGAGTNSGDPLPTVNHMSLIGLIDLTVFELSATEYVVPDGIPLSPLYLQANDANLTDNQGQITFDIEVCRSSGWCFEWNLGDSGAQAEWPIQTCGSSLILGEYTSEGFVSTDHSTYSTGENGRLMPAGLLWDKIEFDVSYAGTGTAHLGVQTGGCGTYTTLDVAPGDSTIHTGASGLDTEQILYLNPYTDVGFEPITIHRVRIFGQDANPFGESNC